MDELLENCIRLRRNFPFREANPPSLKQLLKDHKLKSLLVDLQEKLNTCGAVYSPEGPPPSPPSGAKPLKAVAWNLERGKNYQEILQTLKNHSQLKEADLYFFTEVDWGMVRSDNRNITAELGKALGLYSYFAPSYYNFTKGHGVERTSGGENHLGLHGKSLLSRFPLRNLRVVSMPNATDKLRSKEARVGQKRALLGDLVLQNKTVTLACAHLDAFSSPRMRAQQLSQVAKACQDHPYALIAGDWNTNTLDSTSTKKLIPHILYQLLIFRPTRMVQDHHPYPERRFDRPLFQMLNQYGFDYSNCNELGVGTYDLVTDDEELGQMASDQFPNWTLKYINRLIEKAGGNIALKLDWFAAKNLDCYDRKVVRLNDVRGSKRASDHHPILLNFTINRKAS